MEYILLLCTYEAIMRAFLLSFWCHVSEHEVSVGHC